MERFGQERSCRGETSIGGESTRGGERSGWFPVKSPCTVSSVLAVQQMGMREENLTAIKTKWQEIYVLNSATAKLWLF